ncbi:hypothetical protein M378DRAFT_19586 [Amanita muscaria Koide BX008]|uniref:Uncharacterized protein n=1 Tax=Amanita muscaria (strain Koide BX008) TaxID=946122 RepID=A0A0C2RU52_AMAMK|nr:hypothetical protein M378DRAFT_19586 [Amanita muscaria Koide BX008]
MKTKFIQILLVSAKFHSQTSIFAMLLGHGRSYNLLKAVKHLSMNATLIEVPQICS